jgi:serine/threonine protein kinase/tetratricopeptide (TPR) repeat protein
MKELKQPVDVGPFRLLRPIGAGGMAEVWSAVHSKETLQVALKVLRGGKEDQEVSARAIGREIRSVARLQHPGIIRILDIGFISPQAAASSGGRLRAESPFFAMELAEAGTLRNVMPLRSWAVLQPVLVGVLQALAYSHGRGVIHRDLKPENILMFPAEPEGSRVRLTDFGISGYLGWTPTSLSSQTGLLEYCTPGYAPPEQLVGKTHLLGPWSDLYSVGCLAFELTTGAPPHHGASIFEVVSRQLSGWEPEFRAQLELPRGFEAWLSALLAPGLAERFGHAADALAALVALEPPATVATPDSSGLRALTEEEMSAPTQPSDVQTARTERLGAEAFETEDLLNPWRAARGLAARQPPPVPSDWREPRGRSKRAELIGAGLSLFPIRPVPFVGREAERSLLWDELSGVVSNRRPAAVVIRGSAGSGKTSLAAWLSERVSQLGCAFPLLASHTRFGSPSDGIGPALWRSQRFDRVPADGLDEALQQIIDGFALRASRETLLQSLRPSQIEVGERRARARSPAANETVSELCLAFCTRRPLVLVVDDTHWGWDSLQVVETLLGRAEQAGAPILVVLCVRDDLIAERPAEAAALEKIIANDSTVEMNLEELDEQDCRALVAELLPFTPELIDYVTARSDGVPAHAVQLVTDWVERGHIERSEEGFTLPSQFRFELPGSIHSALNERIERLLAPLSGDARPALELLVALGPSTEESDLLALAAAEGIQVEPALLSGLEEAGLARFDGGRWTMRWQMLAESVEQTARQAGRWKLHHRAAARLFSARVAEGTLGFLPHLGRHFVKAEEWAEAIPVLLRAAQHERFHGRANRGLELLDACDAAIEEAGSTGLASGRAESLVLRSNLLRLIGGPVADWRALASASERLARKGGYPKALVEALRVRAIWLRTTHRYEEGMRVIEEYITIFKTYRDPQARIEASIQKTRMLRAAGRLDEAKVAALETVALSDRGGNTHDRANARVALLELLRARGDLAEMEAVVETLLPSSESPEVPANVRYQILELSGSAHFLLGNYEQGRKCFEAAVEAARTSLSVNLWLRILGTFADNEKSAGFLDEARRLFAQAEPVSESLAGSEAIRLMQANHSILDIQRGDYAAAARRFSAIVFAPDERRDQVFDIAESFIGFFAAQAEDRWAEAEAKLLAARTAVESCANVERDFAVLLEQAGEVCLQTMRFDLARTVIEDAITYWERTGGTAEDIQRCRSMLPEQR